MDRGAETLSPVRFPDPDGAGTGHEPEEVRRTGQPPPGAMEGPASRVHRGAVRSSGDSV